MDDNPQRLRAPAFLAGSVAGSSGHRNVYAGALNVIVALAMVACIVYVPFIGSQNVRLRKQLAVEADSASAAQTLAVTLERNVALSVLEGKALPEPLGRIARSALGSRVTPAHRGFLVFVYTPMACQRAFNDGLQTLKRNRALQASGLETYALVGQQDDADRERALLLRAEGKMPFPMTFVPYDTLGAALFPKADSTFDDEPIYLRLDRNLVVLSAFHADQQLPALLDSWLESLR
jgi:hypothetical protein